MQGIALQPATSQRRNDIAVWMGVTCFNYNPFDARWEALQPFAFAWREAANARPLGVAAAVAELSCPGMFRLDVAVVGAERTGDGYYRILSSCFSGSLKSPATCSNAMRS